MLYISWDKASKIFEPKLINQLNWQNHKLFLHQNHYQAESATWHFYSQNKKLLNHTDFKAQIVLFGRPSNPSNPSTINQIASGSISPAHWVLLDSLTFPVGGPNKDPKNDPTSLRVHAAPSVCHVSLVICPRYVCEVKIHVHPIPGDRPQVMFAGLSSPKS